MKTENLKTVKISKAIELKGTGITHKEISERLSVPVRTLENWFRKYQVSKVNRKVTESEREILMSDRPLNEICDAIDMDYNDVAGYRYRMRSKSDGFK